MKHSTTHQFQRWVAGGLSFFLHAHLVGGAPESVEPIDARLIIYLESGPVEPGQEYAGQITELVKASECQLAGAEGLLRLAVSEELIQSLKQRSVALEIRYPEPRTITLHGLGERTVKADALLIPLTGELAEGGIATIFVHLGSWKAGPYRKMDGVADLRARAASLGVTIRNS